jgi:carboxylesterase
LGRDGIEHGGEFELAGGPDAVLLLHGLTGSTFEMSYVARRLHRAGMRCLAPVMAGHGAAPEALIGVPWVEWVGKARRDLARLEGARRTFVVGCSMGALVACALAHDQPARVDGLVLLAPALELTLRGKIGALLGRSPFLRGLAIAKRGGADVADLEMRAKNPCMDAVPLAAAAELLVLQAHVDRQLPGIAAPALVVMGARDHTVTVSGARRLARRIGSGPAELVLLRRSWHLVGIDVERDRCTGEAVRFLEALPIPGRRSARSSRRRAR